MSAPPAHASSAPRRGIMAGGNWVVDHVKVIDHWPQQDGLARILDREVSNGGAPYNVLKDLARLGATFPLEAVGLLGDDDDGRRVREDCRAHGIDIAQLHITGGADTSYTDVMTVEDSGRRTFFHHCGANALLAPGHFDFTGSRAKILHFGYLLLLQALDELDPNGLPRAVEVFRAARRAGMLVALDCVSEESNRFRTVVAPALPEVDILFANDFEAQRLTGLEFRKGDSIDAAAVEEIARRLLGSGVRRCVVLHAPEAAHALDVREGGHWQPSVRVPPTMIRGAVGAGDALAAGVLYGLHEDWSVARALRLGACVAAACLGDATCSGSILPVDDCLQLGERLGFVAGSRGVSSAV